MDNFYQTQRPYNPYQNQVYTIPYIGNITSVKGAEGCNAFKMGANSSVLLLDEDNPIVWIVRTDGAGYKKDVIPYSITPYVPEPPIDLKALNERLTKMDANTIQELRDKVGQLELSQATAGVLRYPTSWSYGAGPFPPFYGYGCPNAAPAI